MELLFNSVISGTLSIQSVTITTLSSLVIGCLISYVYTIKNTYTKSFLLTLLILPVLVQTVIMLVNGNLGTGVAIAGAFSLVRFRSVAGSAQDIASIFFSMIIGLATGMGYVTFAFFIAFVISISILLFKIIPFGEGINQPRELRILIPESLEFEGIFDDLFDKYTDSVELIRIKTTNMGSLFELQYTTQLKKDTSIKAFLDDIRVRNGNLNVVFGKVSLFREEL